MLDFNDAGPQKEYRLDPDSLFSAKEVEKMTGVKANRIHYFQEAEILTPARKEQRGEGILTYTYYDAVNVLEVYLINRLSGFFLPKRIIKEFFESIRDHRDALNPFKIDEYKGNAFLLFGHDSEGSLKHSFLDKEDYPAGSSVSLVVNLKKLVSELFEAVERLL